jgi:hypothetical protein
VREGGRIADMLVRTALLDAETRAAMAAPAAPAARTESILAGEDAEPALQGGTAATGFPIRCAHCGHVERLRKPVLRGWSCVRCMVASQARAR